MLFLHSPRSWFTFMSAIEASLDPDLVRTSAQAIRGAKGLFEAPRGNRRPSKSCVVRSGNATFTLRYPSGNLAKVALLRSNANASFLSVFALQRRH